MRVFSAVAIHSAMHTYRAASIDEWRKFLRVTSRRHDHQSRYPVKKVAPEHPILKGLPEDWVSPKDELYVIEKMWSDATPLATSVSEADGKSCPVAWVNGFGKARVFGTTFGHSDATFQDPVLLEMLSRGFLWVVGSDNLVDRHSTGPLGDRSLPRRSSGGLRVAEKPTSPKYLRGGAISPKAPRLQTRTAAEIAPPQTGPLRRSERNSTGPLGDRSLPRRSSGGLRVAEKPTPPKYLRDRAISPKAPRLQTRTAAEIAPPQTGPPLRSEGNSTGPLGDRSLPRRSSGGLRVAEKPTVSDGAKTNETCRFKNH